MIEIFAPAVLTHLVYSVFCLVAIAAALVAVETLQRIRRRYRYLRFRLRYAMPFARTLASAVVFQATR